MPPSRVLLAGASEGGIGGAIARRLARDARARGEKLCITVSATGQDPGLSEMPADLRRLGAHGALAIAGDLRDPDFITALVADAAGFCEGLDLVVFAAGRSRHGELANETRQAWADTFAVHVQAAAILAREAFTLLADTRGSLTAIGSVSGTMTHAGRGAYPAAKAALIAMCRQLAAEWAQYGIRVNVVSPGLISTRRRPKPWAPNVVPLARAGTPDDIAGVVSWLAGPDAAYVTGQDITVDGGLAVSALGAVLHG